MRVAYNPETKTIEDATNMFFVDIDLDLNPGYIEEVLSGEWHNVTWQATIGLNDALREVERVLIDCGLEDVTMDDIAEIMESVAYAFKAKMDSFTS